MLLICEGETEKIYFENLKAAERKAEINLKPELPGHRSDCLSIVENAIKQKDEYDLVWCVFDLDTAYKEMNKYKKALEKASNQDIETVGSYPCFEVWFLLHFIYTTRMFADCKQVIEGLRKYIKDYSKRQVYHLRKNLYVELKSRLQDAIKNSVRLERYNSENSITKGIRSNVYKIIEKIIP